uniref:non-specific serine/threonine protein kinase n=1 Tax=Glossina pallidipes TaxID=7398 RepID=A0A1A9ZL67_GLOPL
MPKVAKVKGAASAATGGAKKKSKIYNMPEKIREGTILKDFAKNEWKIGTSIGVGGFGEIYIACKGGEESYDYVVKCEPHDNGPLFVEMHFYMRNAKLDNINKFKREHGLKNLGVPYMVERGSIDINNIKHRFIVMPRYGSDISKHFLSNSRCLPEIAVYRIVLQMLDAYEFIHRCGYVHADLKAANILLGYGKGGGAQTYLVDYGLASRYTTKDFKPDTKKMHNGTIEYTSRDAHQGVATRRGDLEIMGYNIIEWLGVELPWIKEKLLAAPVKVQKAKEYFMANADMQLKKLFPQGTPTPVMEFIKYVAQMKYDDEPDYEKCRNIFKNYLKALKANTTGDIDFKVTKTALEGPSTSKAAKSTAKTKANIKKTQTHLKVEESDYNEIAIDSPLTTSRTLKPTVKSRVNVEKEKLPSYREESDDEEVISASDESDDDYAFESKRPKRKQPLKSPSRRNKLLSKKVVSSEIISPLIKDESNGALTHSNKTASPKQHSPLASTSTKANLKNPHPLLNAKARIKIGPHITMSPSTSANTVVNSNITPTRKPGKTYEFNFELDVSMDANVLVNVRRKKKRNPQDQADADNTSDGGSTPVTRVKVRKVNEDDDSDSPRTPFVTVRKTKRVIQSPMSKKP